MSGVDAGPADGATLGVGVGLGDGDAVATAAGRSDADPDGWLPIKTPIPNPTTAVAPRMAARTGPWPILATVASAVTSSYLDLKYASCALALISVLRYMVVEPSAVCT